MICSDFVVTAFCLDDLRAFLVMVVVLSNEPANPTPVPPKARSAGRPLKSRGILAPALNLAPAFEFSPDDRFVSAITRDGVESWTTSDGSLFRSDLDEIRSFRCLVFSPSGDRIYLSHRSGIVTLDLESGEFGAQVFDSLPKDISSMTVSPDGRTLAAATVAGSVHLYDTFTGSELLTLGEHYRFIWGLQFETNERLRFGTALSDGRHAVVLFDVGNGSR